MHSEFSDLSLSRAAQLCGVEPEFWDIFGNRHVTSRETNEAIVGALGFSTESEEQLRAGLERIERADWTEVLGPCLVMSVEQQPIRFAVQVPEAQGGETARVEVLLEDGESKSFDAELSNLAVVASAHFGHDRYVRKEIEIARTLPLGYHSVQVSVNGLPASEMRLIVAPDRAYLPKFLEEGGRSAGIAVTLYGLRSEHNWGCGDFRDLRNACEWAASEAKVGFLALNPLHAIHNRQPYNASPYLPNSIFYQNFIYLNLEEIEGFQKSPEAQRLWKSEEVQEEIRQLRASDYVEYERLHALKLRFLKLAFQWSMANPDPWRQGHFTVYMEKEGDLLYRFATYCALDEHLHSKNPDLWVWTDWPAEYQDPESAATREFQAKHSEDISVLSVCAMEHQQAAE